MSLPCRISVVIPTYQRCASVRRTLEALARQTISASEYEVIVPIDGSNDGTKEMIERFQAPYRLNGMWQPNQGRAAARNAGIRAAQGHLIVFLDDDMEPVPGFLAAHLDAHPAGSRRAVVGPVPITVDPSSPPIVHYRHRGMNAHLDRLAQAEYKLGFRDMYSGNLSLPLEVLREVGGFDESFKLYGHEDYELALRLIEAGVELGYSPQAVASQHYDKDFAALARDSLAGGQTAVLFARKHPNILSSPKLATYHTGSRPWRLVRSLMLWLSQWLPKFPNWLIWVMTWLERRRPRGLHALYRLTLDYFFWAGARSALRVPQRPDLQRMRIGFGFLVLFALASSVRLVLRESKDVSEIGRPDDITRYEARFREIRPVLASHPRVGYLTTRQPGSSDESHRLAFKRYLLTQYALLPTIVLPGIHDALAVANFDSTTGIDSGATEGLTLIQDSGNGVMLFATPAE
jgi:GT2 family glycosyltransferase